MTNKEIGSRLKDRRLELKLTLQDIATEIGVTKSTVQRYENGAIDNLKLPVIEAMARVLSVEPSWLLGKNDQKEKTPTLTEKDERDIARKLDAIMEEMTQGGDLMFDGDPMSEEAIESIMAAMKLGLEAAKLKNKARFTPKKYRKE